MDIEDILLIGGGLALVYLATRDSGSAQYVSPASWAQIQADPRLRQWREIDATPDATHPHGEWDSMCGTFSTHFGPDACNSGAAYYILMWFKGLDLDPVHLQNYANDYASDIKSFLDNKLYRGLILENMQPGEFILKQGLSV